ncbi:MAG: S-layer homology domain-containing protein, partial [Clostridiales bacterium]|nr:S-layer homology domain-containing protein [Clostridiales bacterium]
VGAGAAFSDQDKIENTEAVDACSALNIINGYEDGAFHPERNIKRAEVTKMICVALNGGEEPNTSTNAKPTFTDVRGTIYAWAEGYIESCYAQGIVDGVNGNRFAPASNVTAAQLAKMLLVSLGYNAKTEQFTGNAWETNVNVRASQKHLYDGLEKMDTSAAVTRDQAAQMVWNAMQAYEVEYKDGVVQDKVVGSTNDKITLLRDKYDAWVYVGTLTNVNSSNITISMTASDRDASDPKPDKDVTAKEFSKIGQDYSALMGQKVKVMFKKGKTNEVIGVYATNDNTVYNTVMNAVETEDGKLKFGDKTYSVDSAIKVYVNGDRLSTVSGKTTDFSIAKFDDTASLFDSVYFAGKTDAYTRNINNNRSADEVKFVDTNDNNKIDTAIVTTVDAAKVTYVSKDEIVAGGKTYKFADEKIASDIEKNDYVAIREDLYNDCKNITRMNKLTGVKLTGLKENPNKYLIDGTWYVEGVKADMNSVKAGDTVNAYTVNGVVFYAKRTSGENATLSDVAIVMAVGTDIQGDKVKILKLDGTTSTEIVDIDNDPGKDYVAKGALREGAAYEYSVKGGEYRFKTLDKTKDYFGDYTALSDGVPANTSSGLAVTGAAGADKSIGGVKVDDSAKIVLIDNYDAATADYKVITGKQFKSLNVDSSANNAYGNGGIAAFKSKVNGVDRVTYGVVAVNGIADSFVTNDHYGYVVEASYKSDDGYTVYTIWNGSENVKVQEKGTESRAKGDVIGYSSITKEDGLADGIVGTIEDVDTNFGLKDGAIYGVNNNKTTISLDGNNTNDITKDTIVLYVDTKDHKGYENGEIREADKDGNDRIQNVMYKLDGTAKDADVELLVVDVKNNLRGEFTYTFGSDATVEEINETLAKEDVDVKVTAALPGSSVLKVGEGSTLTMTEKQTNAVTIELANDATLNLPKDPGSVTVKAVPGAKVVVNGKTYVGDGGILVLQNNHSPRASTVATLTLTFKANDAVEAEVANGTVNVKTGGWTFKMTVAATTGTIKVDDAEAASGVVINPDATIEVRPDGDPDNFKYGEAYTKYGVKFSDDCKTYTVTKADLENALPKKSEFESSALKKLIGGNTGTMYVGLKFARPATTATTVNVVGYGQEAKDIPLNSVVGVGGLSGWTDSSLLAYFPVAAIDATVDPVKATVKENGSYNLKLTWKDASEKVVAVTAPTINRVVK